METLAVKYRPKTFEDVTGQNYTVDILKYQIENDKTKQAYLFSGASGCGKALENSTPVFTEDGWRSIKDIKVGDLVYGSDGNLHKVTGVYPQPPRRLGFWVNFSDGTSICADADHLWSGHFSFVGTVTKPEIKTTKELYEHYTVNDFTKKRTPRFRVKRADAFLYPSRVLEIPPLLYGIFLISIRKIRGVYGLHLSDMRHHHLILEQLLKFGVRFKDGKRVCAFGRYGEFLSELEFDKFNYWQQFIDLWKIGEAGDWKAVYNDKYLYNSVYARVKLLTGILMMAYDRKTLYQLNTNKCEFAVFIKDLVNGLGCNGLVHRYENHGGRAFFRVQIIPTTAVMGSVCEILPFRKFGRDRNFKVCVSIESIVPAKRGLNYTCIEVDAPDHLYVIQNFIVTHNTTVARIFANNLGDKTEIIEVDAASNSGVDNVRALIEEAQFKSLGGGKKVYIVDECFHADTLIMTTNGDIPISKIKTGDLIYNTHGIDKVDKLIINKVPLTRLVRVDFGKNMIFTTKEHLFFTCRGWVCAGDLREEDYLYDYEKGKEINGVRVDSVKIYERGDNEQYFFSIIGDKEKGDGFITMYDLSVRHHHNYIANGVLVHNCHNISKAGMETFLKTLEEPPEDVIFIFCTTEPHKLPKTIQNRMMRFNFTRMEIEQIVERLVYIIETEIKAGLSLKYSKEALSYIARVSHGGMRDAIANMEKCINAERDLTVENVCEVLSLVSYSDLFALTKAVLYKNDGNIISIIEDLHSKGADLKQFVNQFMLFILDLLKFYYTADIDMTELPSFFQEEWDGLGINDILLGEMKQLLAKLMDLNSKLIYETNPKPFIEMILMGVANDRTAS